MDTLTQNYLLPFTTPPVQRWQHQVFDRAGISVDILRLDLMHPVIGGNKWMKLKGFLETALAEGKTGILTKGGPWSNHLHAVAWLCNQIGLECHIWVKGHKGLVNPMLVDIIKWNAILTCINRTLFYDEAAAIQAAIEMNLLYVPMGGAEETNIQHVCNYMKALPLLKYDYAFCAVGTATTFGGLAFVPHNFTQVVGIDAGTNDAFVQRKIQQWQQALPDKTLSLLTDYSFGGFAKYTPELLHFMNKLFETHQMPTDIVYTGKLFNAVLQLAEMQYFPMGVRLLIVHSGGLQGNRSLPAGSLQF